MKKTILLFLTLITTCNFYSQEITVEEPEFEGQIFYVDNNNPVDLEETTYYIKKGQSIGRMISGIGKVKARIIVDGKTSTTKIPKQEKISFVCNYNSSNKTLPSKVIECLKFDQRKKTREYLVSSVSNVSGQNTSSQFKFEKFKGKKYGKHSYLVEFTNLEPGEYGFSIGGKDSGRQMYMFTIVK